MKFIKNTVGVWCAADCQYYIRETCGTFYVYSGKVYVGSRDSFDEAKALAEREASK